jgi:hypothetical protein
VLAAGQTAERKAREDKKVEARFHERADHETKGSPKPIELVGCND